MNQRRLPQDCRQAVSEATAADRSACPAHFTGICGLKPTPGRVPATGHFPPCGGPFALTGVVGPMARTVDDVALLLAVMAGPDTGDPNAIPYRSDRSTMSSSDRFDSVLEPNEPRPPPRRRLRRRRQNDGGARD